MFLESPELQHSRWPETFSRYSNIFAESQPYSVNPPLHGQLSVLMSFDMRHGQLFDINRPFGNGQDEGNNAQLSVVDEPNERTLNQPLWSTLYGNSYHSTMRTTICLRRMCANSMRGNCIV